MEIQAGRQASHSKWIHSKNICNDIKFHRSKRNESWMINIKANVWKSHDNNNNGNNKTIKTKPHTLTRAYILWRSKGEGMAEMKKTHVYCVSNKIKYLTPFARKIQRPLFKRTNERTSETNDCGLLRSANEREAKTKHQTPTQWLRVLALTAFAMHTQTQSHKNM